MKKVFSDIYYENHPGLMSLKQSDDSTLTISRNRDGIKVAGVLPIIVEKISVKVLKRKRRIK